VLKETIVALALALTLTSCQQPLRSANAGTFTGPATVVDGDTVRIAGVSIRLTDYDSPELYSPKCPRERTQAEAAKRELERIIGQVKLELVPCATANYGRLCAEGSIDGKPLAAYMISRGLASPYVCWTGGCPRKRDWC
jgi:endonuclease YncB( thermonuclease family)